MSSVFDKIREEGWRAGFLAAELELEQEAAFSTAKRMLAAGALPIPQIAELTGLLPEQVLALSALYSPSRRQPPSPYQFSREDYPSMFNKSIRPRRLRAGDSLRRMVRETRVSPDSLIYPVFLAEGSGIYREIPSLPKQYHYSPDELPRLVEKLRFHGVSRILLFGLPAHKDPEGTSAWAENGIVQQGIRRLRELMPEVYIVTDVCMCEYTSHGHCGILCGREVDNDLTLDRLAEIAVSHAAAGADMVAPSDMMDGRVAAIRERLDANGFQNIPIMAYSAKYASSFYGPFRDAAGSAPSFGDRRSYQMDWHNAREAMRECELDVREGADILMVKPALAYLDLIHEARARFELPLAAYSVSGEYAMIKAAAAAKLIDEHGVMCESAIAVFRAGADILITYYACELADAIRAGEIG